MQNQLMRKLILVLLILLFLFVSVTAFISYFLLNNRLTDELENTNMQLLSQIDQKLELVLQHVDKLSFQTLSDEEVKDFLDAEITGRERLENSFNVTTLMTNMINSDEYIFSIDLYSFQNKQNLSSYFSSDDLINFEWLDQFEKYEGYFDWMTTRRLMIQSGNYPIYRDVVTLARKYPIISPNPRGVIAINIKEEELYSLLGNDRDVQIEYTFIVDDKGQVVLHHDNDKLGKDISEYTYIKSLLNSRQDHGIVQAEVNGTESTVFYLTSSYTDWKIIRVIPDVRYDESLVALRNTIFFIAMFLFAIAAISGVFAAFWTFKPMNRFFTSMSTKLNMHSHNRPVSENSSDFAYFESMVENVLNDRARLQTQIVETKPIMKWRLLMELLFNYRANFTELKTYMDLHGIHLYSNHFVVMSIEFDDKENITNLKDLHLYTYALCNVVEELINAESKGAAIELENGQCAVIMSFDDEEDTEKQVIRAVSVADMIKNFVMESFKRTVTIGIGGSVYSMKDIHLSYKQSQEVLKYKLIMGNNTVITADDTVGYQSREYQRLLAMSDSIIDALKVGDGDKLRKHLRKWFDDIAQHKIPPDMIKHLNTQCLMRAATVADEVGVPLDELIPSHHVYDSLNQLERLDKIQAFMVKMLEEFMERIKVKRNSREKNDLIEKVLKYIQKHYTRSDLSLNYLADHFHVSVSHLSKLFKEYTSSNFTDYLMEIRINRSKQLLAESNKKVKEIAETVGYTNVNSFVRVFKKMTGLTPSEYREKKRLK
ncbi:helix-turn-helix domain-containing protein [Chengkuizengella axinellae]|uniref:Helix-turn-helix domain-containing protein n=1 Tax=Chengkuizengella axinellae TaxID=3064388 RepID=A0ABT9IU87_9BACL|nr:helix-turn-helix domain-containing protein [Chengkuizengella sp. 2205SS18-9]MDP5272657.1 helix-turn-helix domain-containing protein [Chengkuizengella sp. 2205SS18-9]